MSIPNVDIKFNKKMLRWEVFSEKSVVRRGKKQPVFVSENFTDCVEYVEKVRAS